MSLNPLNDLHSMGISRVASWTVPVMTEMFLDERSLFEAAQLLGWQRNQWKTYPGQGLRPLRFAGRSPDERDAMGSDDVSGVFKQHFAASSGFFLRCAGLLFAVHWPSFCSALAFFLPVGPRCDLRAGGLSLGKQANVRNGQRIKQRRSLTLPIGLYCC